MNATLNLIDQLKQIPDYRKGKGRRHSLWLVLMLVLLGTLDLLQKEFKLRQAWEAVVHNCIKQQ